MSACHDDRRPRRWNIGDDEYGDGLRPRRAFRCRGGRRRSARAASWSCRSPAPMTPTACRGCSSEIWATDDVQPIVAPEIIRTVAHVNGYGVMAVSGSDIVGAALGFLGRDRLGTYLHSYIAGVTERLRGGNVGFALKQHQRAWALSHELNRVTWTFDPLVRRNAYFNLVKLGATAVAFHRELLWLDAGHRERRRPERSDPHRVEPRRAPGCAGECPAAPAGRPAVARRSRRRCPTRDRCRWGARDRIRARRRRVGADSGGHRRRPSRRPRARPASGDWRCGRRSVRRSRRATTPTA